MKKYRFFAFAIAVLFLAGCGVASNPTTVSGNTSTPPVQSSTDSSNTTPENVTYIRLASAMNEGDLTANPVGPATVYFMEQLKERTNGAYEVQIYLNNQLGSTAEEVIGGCQTGAFEMINYTQGNWSGHTKAFTPLSIPYLFSSQEVVDAFVDSDIGEEMRQKCLEDTDIYILSFGENGFRNITNNTREVHSPADLKGLKMRTMNDPFQIACMEAFGVSATSVPYSEMYSALQQNLIDAQENPFTNIYSSRVYEVQKYITASNHQFTFSGLFISNNFLRSLPEDVQQIIIELGREHEEMARASSRELQNAARQTMEEYGCIITDLTDEEFNKFRDIAKTAWSSIEEQLGSEYFNRIISTVEAIEASLA